MRLQKIEKLGLFHLQSLRLPSAYDLSSFPQICVSLLPPPAYRLDDLDGDLNGIKLEPRFWSHPLLNSHGDLGKGFRESTPTFWLNARLANSTPPRGCCSASVLLRPG